MQSGNYGHGSKEYWLMKGRKYKSFKFSSFFTFKFLNLKKKFLKFMFIKTCINNHISKGGLCVHFLLSKCLLLFTLIPPTSLGRLTLLGSFLMKFTSLQYNELFTIFKLIRGIAMGRLLILLLIGAAIFIGLFGYQETMVKLVPLL
ncbi:hypothetical protein ACJX0J_018766, partial [Zea mays]